MFQPSDLSVLAYANNFTFWHYTTSDAFLSEVLEGNYFGRANDMLRANDLIICNTDTDGEPETNFLIVASNEEGIIRVKRY